MSVSASEMDVYRQTMVFASDMDEKRQTMNSSSHKDDKPLPHGSSRWDKLPKEIQDMMFKYTSPLTLLANDMLKLDTVKDGKAIHTLWVEAFDIDWPGDLELLPRNVDNGLCPTLENADLTRVKSRSMYHRLCAIAPYATETNPKFAEHDQLVEYYNKPENSKEVEKGDSWIDGDVRLLYIPMRHMWLDLLGDTLDKFPYARAQDCIIEGHIDLLRHLIDIGKVDLRHIVILHKEFSNDSIRLHAMDVAAGRGHLGILKMLYETGCQKASTMAMDWAAYNGHLDVVKWLHENRSQGCTTSAMAYAAHNGHLEVFNGA